MSARETLAQEEEEGADEEEGQEVGAARVAFDVTKWGHFAANCAALLQIDSLLMAPMTWKRGGGIVTCICVRMCVIAKGKMSLSCVSVS